jgi:hypothetical protein
LVSRNKDSLTLFEFNIKWKFVKSF